MVLLLSIALPLTMTDVDGLAVAGMVTSFAAALFGFLSGQRVCQHLSRRAFPQLGESGILLLERSWGYSVACHCLSLLATGLHTYFAVQIISDCSREKPKEGVFRLSCDSGENARVFSLQDSVLMSTLS